MTMTVIAPYNLDDLGSDAVIDITITRSLKNLVPDNLIAYLSLQSNDTIISNGKVVQLGDLSGNGHHFYQSDTSKQPTYTALDANYGYRTSMTFDGVDDELTASLDLSAYDTITIYFLCRPDSYTGDQTIFGSDIANNPSSFEIRATDNPVTQIKTYYANPGGTYTNKELLTGSLLVQSNSFVYSEINTSGGSTSIPTASYNASIDLAYVLTDSIGAAKFSSSIYGIGANGVGGNPFAGSITDIVIVSGSIATIWQSFIYDFAVTSANVGNYSKTSGSFFTTQRATIEDIDYECLMDSVIGFFNSVPMYSTFPTLENWTGSFDYSLGKIQLSCSQLYGGKITFNNEFTRKLFGIDDGTTIYQSLYTSSVTPYFHWRSTEKQWSEVKQQYEGKGIVREELADDGRAYQISNEDDYTWLSNIPGNYTWKDWKYVFESKANVFSDFSSSLAPYTWQEHLSHVRSYRPFLVYDNTNETTGSYEEREGTYKIRSNESKFDPDYAIDDYDQYWNVPVKTRRLSQGTNFGTYITSSLGASFLPTQIDDCLIWLRSDLGIVTESYGGNNVITSWYDQSGNNNHFTQSTLASGAYYTASYSEANSLPVINFSASLGDISKSLYSQNIIDYNSTVACSMFFVGRFTNSISDSVANLNYKQTIFATRHTGSNPYYGTFVYSQGPGTNLFSYFSFHFYPTSSNAINKLSNEIYTIVQSNSYFNASVNWNINFYKNNSTTDDFFKSFYINNISKNLINSTLFGSASYIEPSITYIGSVVNMVTNSPYYENYFKGYIQEIIFYNRELLDSERTQVQNYLNERYGYTASLT